MVIRKKSVAAQVGAAKRTGKPIKQQVRLEERPAGAATATKVQVVSEKPGTTTFFDKAKYYYKGAIIALGSLLVILNQVTPIFSFLGDNQAHNVFNAVVLAVTTVLAILKENEKWVDKLPSAS